MSFDITILPKKPLFSIYALEETSEYAAVKDKNPRFVVVGKSIGEVAEKAIRCIDFHRTIKNPVAHVRSE